MPYVESIKVFLRVVELGSITAGGRDMRLTPAVASNRIKELESRLGVRLFNRTTRKLTPTEVGTLFYEQAKKFVEMLDEAEAIVSGFADNPRGVIRVTAPLGLGRRTISPLIPKFCDSYPGVEIRLRLSDRKVDILEDQIDVAFFLGTLTDSNLKWRKIRDCDRVLVASPAYLARKGVPKALDDLLSKKHNCLLLRFPRSPEYFWTFETRDGPRKIEPWGQYDADDADVLTAWALSGRGIANRPRFEIAEYLKDGRLVEVLQETPPVPISLGCLYPHRRFQDPKVRIFVDFMIEEIKKALS